MNVAEYIVKYVEYREIDHAYVIVGGAALWISGMSGSPSGVIGLPLHAVYLLLKKAGYAF